MRASRRYFTTIMAAAVTLCTFLATFIILAMVLAAAIVGPQFLQPAAHLSCGAFGQAAPGLPCPKTALNLYKISQVLGAFALCSLFFGYVFNSLGLADLESDAVRDSYLKGRNGGYANPHMGYAEVITPTLYFWLGVIFTAMGVMIVLAAVCAAMASSVTHHDWSFHTVVTVLVFAAVIGPLVLLICMLMRREAPVAEYVQYNNNIAMAPVVGGPIVNPAAAP